MSDKYFDLHIQGIGYLSRAREVKPKRSSPFLAVDITAIHGPADDIQRVRFDAKVAGSEAQKVIQDLMPIINDRDRKVLASFKTRRSVCGPVHIRNRREGRPNRRQPQNQAAPPGLGQGRR